MLLIQQKSTNPYFNIAAEEYLLKNFSDDIFTLYINEPSIIVGKHQNTLAEINQEFVRSQSIKVVRRLSGGGTVYHDLGNLNYSFIANGSEGKLVDFKKFTQPIVDILLHLGIDAQLGGKNDIRIGEMKISGNAEHIYKNRVLHHGTLLFSSELDELNESIRVNPSSYTDKSVKSIRSNVANISDYLKDKITINEFTTLVVDHIKQTTPNCSRYNLTKNDITAINRLIDTKYSTWEWNFGYSPTYELIRQISQEDYVLKIRIHVEKGIIVEIKFEVDSLSEPKLLALEQMLTGLPHDFDVLSGILSSVNLDDYLPKIGLNALLKGFF
jgi:lipoate-protein ligase A